MHSAGFTHGALDASYIFEGPLVGGVGLAEAAGEVVEPADDFRALDSLRDPPFEPAPTRRRRFPAVTLAAAAVVFAATVFLATPSPARTDWKAVLTRLDALRVQAFETGDLAILQRADTGQALQRDTVTLQRLRGHRLAGLHFTIASVTGSPDRLLVTDVMSGYHLDGSSILGRRSVQWVIGLQPRARNDWRIARVEVARPDRNVHVADP